MKKPLLHILFAFSSGIIFGLGLILAGMSNPAKVLAFLDIAGLWDPSLMFVMGGAIGVGIVAFAFAKKRTTAILGGVMHRAHAEHDRCRCTVGRSHQKATIEIYGFR